MRQFLKRRIPRRFRFFLRLENYKDLFLFSGCCFKRFFFFLYSLPASPSLSQSIPNVRLFFSPEYDSERFQIAEIFSANGINFNQGRHCLYVSDTNDLQRIAPGLTGRYPVQIALKIIKSTEISQDGTPYFTSRKTAPATNFISMLAVGTVLEKVIISNILSIFGCAPRVYDLIRLTSGDIFFYAFVVEHVDGAIAKGETGRLFINNFKKILRKQHIEIVAVKRSKDFQPPEFNQNLIVSSTGCKYIDIQNFAIFSHKCRYPKEIVEKLDPSDVLSGTESLKRNNLSIFTQWVLNKRIVEFSNWCGEFLSNSGFSFEDSTLFDAGFPLGLYSMSALANGARWSWIIDDKTEGTVTAEFLFRHGFSRFSLFPYPFEEHPNTKKSVDLLCYSFDNDWNRLHTLLAYLNVKYLLLDYPVSGKGDQKKEKETKRPMERQEIRNNFVSLTETMWNNTSYIFFKKTDFQK